MAIHPKSEDHRVDGRRHDTRGVGNDDQGTDSLNSGMAPHTIPESTDPSYNLLKF